MSKSCCCSKLCPFSLGLALGFTAMVCAALMMYFGVQLHMDKSPYMTYISDMMKEGMGSAYGYTFLHGFIMGFLIAIFYDIVRAICMKTCGKKCKPCGAAEKDAT